MPTVTVAAAGSSSIVEGTIGKIIVSRTGDTNGALIVRYKAAGAARAGTDYKKLTGMATIPAGESQVKIKIKTIDNQIVNGTRVVKIKLLPASDGSYNLGDVVVAKLKITDND